MGIEDNVISPLVPSNNNLESIRELVEDNEPLNYYLTNTGEGRLAKIRNAKGGRPDDLTNGVKRRLGDFIGKKTHDSHNGNQYPINPIISEFSMRDEHGRPIENVQISTSAEETFTTQTAIDSNAVNRFINHNETTRIPRVRPDNIHHGRSSAPGINGNQLLVGSYQSISDNIGKKVNTVLNTNRFNPDRQFTSLFNDDDKNVILAGYQPDLGKYTAKTTKESPELSMEDLKKVGFMMMLEASGKFVHGSDDDPGPC
jgi:hypothetical protein